MLFFSFSLAAAAALAVALADEPDDDDALLDFALEDFVVVDVLLVVVAGDWMAGVGGAEVADEVTKLGAVEAAAVVVATFV